MTAERRVLIMAGGTGGHIFPALSIARSLIDRGIAVEWLGTRRGMETRLLSGTDIPLHYISVSGLRGKSMMRKVLGPLIIVRAIVQSLLRLWVIKPSCVLGMGGFVTGPGGVAAWLLRKKLIIHEQNAIAGFSNQMLFPFATIVMEGFPGAFARKQEISGSRLLRATFKPGKTLHVGNPLRVDFLNCPDPAERFTGERAAGERLRLLVLGGSLGSVAINSVVPQLLARFSAEERPRVLHQCGAGNLDTTLKNYRQQEITDTEDIKVQPFVDDMAAAYAQADIVLCRSGALTVSEVAAVGLPAIFVPYPYAVDDHQTENAAFLEKLGAAWVVQEPELTAPALEKILRQLMANREQILKIAMLSRQAGKKDATEKAAAICAEVCNG